MRKRLIWSVWVMVALACGCGSVDPGTKKQDAAVDVASSTNCVLDQSKLDSCKL